jgi:hypothetical protein
MSQGVFHFEIGYEASSDKRYVWLICLSFFMLWELKRFTLFCLCLVDPMVPPLIGGGKGSGREGVCVKNIRLMLRKSLL